MNRIKHNISNNCATKKSIIERGINSLYLPLYTNTVSHTPINSHLRIQPNFCNFLSFTTKAAFTPQPQTLETDNEKKSNEIFKIRLRAFDFPPRLYRQLQPYSSNTRRENREGKSRALKD